MMNQTLDDAINDQVNAELSASYTPGHELPEHY